MREEIRNENLTIDLHQEYCSASEPDIQAKEITAHVYFNMRLVYMPVSIIETVEESFMAHVTASLLVVKADYILTLLDEVQTSI